MAAIRATREGTVKQGRETLPVIIGTPLKGETIGNEEFDGKSETAIFPGDLPEKIDTVLNMLPTAGRPRLNRRSALCVSVRPDWKGPPKA